MLLFNEELRLECNILSLIQFCLYLQFHTIDLRFLSIFIFIEFLGLSHFFVASLSFLMNSSILFVIISFTLFSLTEFLHFIFSSLIMKLSFW